MTLLKSWAAVRMHGNVGSNSKIDLISSCTRSKLLTKLANLSKSDHSTTPIHTTLHYVTSIVARTKLLWVKSRQGTPRSPRGSSTTLRAVPEIPKAENPSLIHAMYLHPVDLRMHESLSALSKWCASRMTCTFHVIFCISISIDGPHGSVNPEVKGIPSIENGVYLMSNPHKFPTQA